MEEELSVLETVNRLRGMGRNISAPWLSQLCREGRGPAYRETPPRDRRAKPALRIQWADAQQWAERNLPVAQNFEDRRRPDPPLEPGIFADLCAYLVQTTWPLVWAEWCSRAPLRDAGGVAERRDRINRIGAEVAALVLRKYSK